LILVLVAFGIGYFLGGPNAEIRKVLGLGTALRNFAAAITVAALNFTDPDVLVMVLVIILVTLVVLIIIGKKLGQGAGDGKTPVSGIGT